MRKLTRARINQRYFVFIHENFYVRLLEEGDLSGAETVKSQLEQKQRDRRKEMESKGIQHEPKWFR